MYIEKMTMEEKETLKKLANDYKIFQLTESESKKEKEKTGKAIKTILDKYGFNGIETIDIFSIQYKDIEKTTIDSEKLKDSGLYEMFSKTTTTKPLTIR